MPIATSDSLPASATPRRRPSPWLLLAIAFLVANAIALAIALRLATRGPAPVADVPLTDQDGHVTRWSDYRGRHVIVYFGYTGCPDVCPTGLTDLAHAIRGLGAAARDVQVLFVSLDPTADTPAQLKRYVPYFHPAFRGLVPAPDRLAEVTREFGATFRRVSLPGGGTRIEHSTTCYILNPRGQIDGFFLTPVSTEALRRQLGLAS
jgi:protein SCO1/2